LNTSSRNSFLCMKSQFLKNPMIFRLLNDKHATRRKRNRSDSLGSSFVYYESIKRELQKRPISKCRCDERLKTKSEESTRLTYTGLLGELENLKTKTRLIDEKFASVMSESDLDVMGAPSRLRLKRKTATLMTGQPFFEM
jgi:hypothetical protein